MNFESTRKKGIMLDDNATTIFYTSYPEIIVEYFAKYQYDQCPMLNLSIPHKASRKVCPDSLLNARGIVANSTR